MSVRYEKQMRDRAMRDGKGLVSIDVTGKPFKGKFNGRMCVQGPADDADLKLATDFLLKYIERQADRKAGEPEDAEVKP